MNDLDFRQMIEEAHSIPITEVAALVMDGFTCKGNVYTGRCNHHTDNNLGNVSFKLDKNFARCFACGTNWTTINMVKDYMSLDFKSAMQYLYNNFPSYFSKSPNFAENKDFKKRELHFKWEGLTGEEYRYLKFNTKYFVEGKSTPIRTFALMFPKEHDEILIRRIKDIFNQTHSFYRNALKLGVPKIKLDKDRIEFDKKILELLKKGLLDKKRLDPSISNLYDALKSL